MRSCHRFRARLFWFSQSPCRPIGWNAFRQRHFSFGRHPCHWVRQNRWQREGHTVTEVRWKREGQTVTEVRWERVKPSPHVEMAKPATALSPKSRVQTCIEKKHDFSLWRLLQNWCYSSLCHHDSNGRNIWHACDVAGGKRVKMQTPCFNLFDNFQNHKHTHL